MEPAPSRACSARPCPSRMPGPAPLPLWSTELRKGGGAAPPAQGSKPRGAEGLVRWLEGRQHPCALAWPGADLALSCGAWARRAACGGQELLPFGPETGDGAVQAFAPVLPGKS